MESLIQKTKVVVDCGGGGKNIKNQPIFKIINMIFQKIKT